MKVLALTVGAAIALALGTTPDPVLAQTHASTSAPSATSAAVAAPALHSAMRDLWHGHIETTRNYARAVHADDSSAAQHAADAVVANAGKIADAVAGFYGADAGKGMLKLLGGHWQGVKDLTDSAKKGDKPAEDKAMRDLAANAGEIAAFLAGANPHLPEESVRGALVMHGADHQTQIDLMMANAPEARQAAAWERMREHMDMIADTLSDGIAKQFPDKAK